MADHIVGDQGRRNALLAQLPGCQPGALQKRPRFGHEDREVFALLPGGADHSQGRTVAGRGQGAGITVGEDACPRRDQRRPVAAQTTVGLDIFGVQGQGFVFEAFAQTIPARRMGLGVDAPHALNGPEQVDRSGTGRGKNPAQPIKGGRPVAGLELSGAERQPHGRSHANGRCTANNHGSNRPGNALVVGIGPIEFAGRQEALIEHDHRSRPAGLGLLPFDGEKSGRHTRHRSGDQTAAPRSPAATPPPSARPADAE